MSVLLEQIKQEHDVRCLPPLLETALQTGREANGGKSLFALQAQINEHKAKEAARSCLDQLIGLVYHPDSDSLAVLEKLYADVRLQTQSSSAVHHDGAKHTAAELTAGIGTAGLIKLPAGQTVRTRELTADSIDATKLLHAGQTVSAVGFTIDTSDAARQYNNNEILRQIWHDRQSLAERDNVDRVFNDIAENGVLFIKGKVGVAVTLGTYVLNHIHPADGAPKVVLSAGEGAIEGGLFRTGIHVADRVAHHAGVTITRYVSEALRPQLQTAGKTCIDVLKSWKPPVLLIHKTLGEITTSQTATIETTRASIYKTLGEIVAPVAHTAPAMREMSFATTAPVIAARHETDAALLLPRTVIHHHPLPASPIEAFDTVNHMMKNMPLACADGPLLIAEHNAQLANADKASLYHQAYKYMFSRAHLIFLEEVDPEFCRTAAESISYRWCASRVNSRGQGLGFLLHPRLEIMGEPVNLEPLANVYHFHDLRPGFIVHLKDTRSGVQFDAVAVHLKSMCGGGYTHGVRYAQATELTKLVSDKCPTILGGDWNFFLNQPEREMSPLQHAGFQLIDPASDAPTQELGGRLDGFMTRNTPWNFSNCETFNFWHDLHRRSFSDHGMLLTRMDVVGN